MSPAKNEFGAFGATRPVKRRSLFSRLLIWGVLLGVGISIPLAFTGWRDIYTGFLEKEPPTITTPNMPAGLGSEGMEFKIVLQDVGSGLDEVVVRSEQNNETRELLRKRYPEKTEQDTVTVSLPGKESGYEEGQFRINVSVFDRSFWTNGKSTSFDFQVDYSKPKIEVITTQHNAVLGGAELVFYRVIDNDPNVFGGVKAGEWLFPGFPAKNLDPEFQNETNLYFTFFPIPKAFRINDDKIRLFARDAVGNLSTANIFYRVAPVKFLDKELKLSEQFMRDKVADLLPKYLAIEARMNHRKQARKLPEPRDLPELLEQFRIINGELRKVIEELLVTLLSRPKASKLWSGTFSRQAGAAQQAGFGESRTYTFNGENVGQSTHWGVDLASTPNSPVRAGNKGIVIFADDLGIYGNTVIIDHGFGLTTLYGHLTSASVAEGDNVEKDQEIGRTGNTGFAEGDHLHFEVRLHGVPVRPIEWWDAKWLRDHVDLKIEETKKALGIRTARTLE